LQLENKSTQLTRYRIVNKQTLSLHRKIAN